MAHELEIKSKKMADDHEKAEKEKKAGKKNKDPSQLSLPAAFQAKASWCGLLALMMVGSWQFYFPNSTTHRYLDLDFILHVPDLSGRRQVRAGAISPIGVHGIHGYSFY